MTFCFGLAFTIGGIAGVRKLSFLQCAGLCDLFSLDSVRLLARTMLVNGHGSDGVYFGPPQPFRSFHLIYLHAALRIGEGDNEAVWRVRSLRSRPHTRQSLCEACPEISIWCKYLTEAGIIPMLIFCITA